MRALGDESSPGIQTFSEENIPAIAGLALPTPRLFSKFPWISTLSTASVGGGGGGGGGVEGAAANSTVEL